MNNLTLQQFCPQPRTKYYREEALTTGKTIVFLRAWLRLLRNSLSQIASLVLCGCPIENLLTVCVFLSPASLPQLIDRLWLRTANSWKSFFVAWISARKCLSVKEESSLMSIGLMSQIPAECLEKESKVTEGIC